MERGARLVPQEPDGVAGVDPMGRLECLRPAPCQRSRASCREIWPTYLRKSAGISERKHSSAKFNDTHQIARLRGAKRRMFCQAIWRPSLNFESSVRILRQKPG